MPTERPLIIDAGVVRETTTEDSVPATVFWGRVKNDSGGTLTKGTPVYQISATGFTPTVGAADAANAAKMPAIGLLWETLADQAEGAVIYLGLIKDINTNSFNIGDAIYVASGGGLTNTAPTGTGELDQYIGLVTRKDATNGAIQVLGTGREDIYPGAGIAVSTGHGWDTSLTAPSGALVGTTDTQTLTNKRINPRVSSASTFSINFTPNSDNYDLYAATAQTLDTTIEADSGTPVNGQKLIFRIKDNNVNPRNITWANGTSKSYRAIGVTLPTVTTLNKTLYIGCIYNALDDRWDAVAVTEEV